MTQRRGKADAEAKAAIEQSAREAAAAQQQLLDEKKALRAREAGAAR